MVLGGQNEKHRLVYNQFWSSGANQYGDAAMWIFEQSFDHSIEHNVFAVRSNSRPDFPICKQNDTIGCLHLVNILFFYHSV
jgi:hypothetical protein